jgi:chromosome segregation ATPase
LQKGKNMKLDNPTELAALVAKADEQAARIVELEAAQAEFETTKTELETAKDALAEVTTEVEALRTENADFKTALDAVEDVAGQIEAEVTKNVELTGQLETQKVDFEKKIDEYEAQLIEQKERSEAFEALATEYAKDTEKVQDQFELLSQHLGKHALVPAVEQAGTSEEAPKSYTTYMELANSNNPEDRRMARLMKKNDPTIDAFSRQQAGVPESAPNTTTTNFSDEDVAIFTKWKALRAEATQKWQTDGVHDTKVVEARRLYKQHQSVIDAQINAAQAA